MSEQNNPSDQASDIPGILLVNKNGWEFDTDRGTSGWHHPRYTRPDGTLHYVDLWEAVEVQKGWMNASEEEEDDPTPEETREQLERLRDGANKLLGQEWQRRMWDLINRPSNYRLTKQPTPEIRSVGDTVRVEGLTAEEQIAVKFVEMVYTGRDGETNYLDGEEAVRLGVRMARDLREQLSQEQPKTTERIPDPFEERWVEVRVDNATRGSSDVLYRGPEKLGRKVLWRIFDRHVEAPWPFHPLTREFDTHLRVGTEQGMLTMVVVPSDPAEAFGGLE